MRLYEAARDYGTWDARKDIDWTRATPLRPEREELAWNVACQAVYAEQLGLSNAAALINSIDDLGTRYCLAIQASDEAKHSEVFARYALRNGLKLAPPMDGVNNMEAMVEGLDSAMERFLVHTFLEGVALDEFLILRDGFEGDILHDIYGYVIKDEARHVAMGMAHLERLIATDKWPSAAKDLQRYREIAISLCGIDEYAIDWLAHVTGRSPKSVADWFSKRHNERINRLVTRLTT
jgi:hypothetical protein